MTGIVRWGHGPMKAFKSRTASWLTWFGAIIAAALVAPGCGGSSANSNSVQVWGRVTYNGTPVQGGAVIFQPGPTTTSNTGIGLISEEGKYAFFFSDVTDLGFKPGRFQISIKPPSPHDKRKHSRLGEEEEESDEKAIAIAAMFPVPKRFFSPETSGLWGDLEREPTRVDIDLND
jgi:hypothetical protein